MTQPDFMTVEDQLIGPVVLDLQPTVVEVHRSRDGAFRRIHLSQLIIDVDGRRELDRVLHLVWDRYYPVSESMDLAYYLSYAFHELGDLPTAIEMLRHSLEIYGPTGWTLYNLAQCLQEMGDLDAAEVVARQAGEHAEARDEATAMLAAIAEARLSS